MMFMCSCAVDQEYVYQPCHARRSVRGGGAFPRRRRDHLDVNDARLREGILHHLAFQPPEDFLRA